MTVEILIGDALTRLSEMAPESVHCAVTSPPYFGLRDYGVDGQIGLELTPEEYIAALVPVFREVRRVLRADGTLWLNIGDSYANDGKWGGSTSGKHVGALHGETVGRGKRRTGLKPKDLIGIPWMLAFALRADGWWLRQDVIWSKPNAMPESINDRCTKSHEYLFLLTKGEQYFYDADAIAEPTRNKRSVWSISTSPYLAAHFATMPPALVEPCILAGTSAKGCCAACGTPIVRILETASRPNWQGGDGQKHNGTIYRPNIGGGVGNDRRDKTHLGWEPSCTCDAPTVPTTVLDPFGGAGTVGLVADRLQRNAVMIEINPAYAAMARDRINSEAGVMFGAVASIECRSVIRSKAI